MGWDLTLVVGLEAKRSGSGIGWVLRIIGILAQVAASGGVSRVLDARVVNLLRQQDCLC